MKIQGIPSTTGCPVTRQSVGADAKAAFENLVRFCETCDKPFWLFEKELLVLIAVLGCCLIRLFLTARYERLDLQPFLKDGKYRPGDDYAERTLKTVYGEVTYGRHYLMRGVGGSGFFPLDVVLGLTRDRLVAVGDAMGGAVGDTDEFQSRANGVQGGAELGAGHRDDRASGVRHGTRGGAVHATTQGARW